MTAPTAPALATTAHDTFAGGEYVGLNKNLPVHQSGDSIWQNRNFDLCRGCSRSGRYLLVPRLTTPSQHHNPHCRPSQHFHLLAGAHVLCIVPPLLDSCCPRSCAGCSPALHPRFTIYMRAFSSLLLGMGYRVFARIVLDRAPCFVSQVLNAHPLVLWTCLRHSHSSVSGREFGWKYIIFDSMVLFTESIQTIMKR